MFCSKCGKEIPANHQCCPYCGAPIAVTITPPVYVAQPQKNGCLKILGSAVIIIFGIGALAGIMGGTSKKTNSSAQNTTPTSGATPPTTTQKNTTKFKQTPVPSTPAPSSKFEGNCGITASAHLVNEQYINHPKLKISVQNISRKDICAIKFYAVPYDVYGNDISSSIFSQKSLYTDDLIPAGKGEDMTFGPFLDQSMKSVKLYVYSVYFDDGTEWGDKEATRAEILKFAKPIHATFEK